MKSYAAALIFFAVAASAAHNGDAVRRRRDKQATSLGGTGKIPKQGDVDLGLRSLKSGKAEKSGKGGQSLLPEAPPDDDTEVILPPQAGEVCTTDLKLPPLCAEGWVRYENGIPQDGNSCNSIARECCIGDGACEGFTGHVCKDGSCDGEQSCYEAKVDYIGGYRTLDAALNGPSCIGQDTCLKARGRVIEGGSCAGYPPYSSFDSSQALKDWWGPRRVCMFAEVEEIQNGACQGPYACQSTTGNIISDSCKGYAACGGVGEKDGFNIIQQSCDGVCACQVEIQPGCLGRFENSLQSRPNMFCDCNGLFECRSPGATDPDNFCFYSTCCYAARKTGGEDAAAAAGCQTRRVRR